MDEIKRVEMLQRKINECRLEANYQHRRINECKLEIQHQLEKIVEMERSIANSSVYHDIENVYNPHNL